MHKDWSFKNHQDYVEVHCPILRGVPKVCDYLGQKAILTGLPIFLGEGVAAHTQASSLVADH